MLVRAWGLEPQRIAAREPKGDVTTVKVTNLLKSRNTTRTVVFRLFKFLECNVIEDRNC